MKHFTIIVFFTFFIMTLSCCVPKQDVLPDNPYIVGDGNKPMVIAHGGAKLLFPENTVLAFDSSFLLGVDVLEMDIRLTKDSILVTHHDAGIDNTSDGSGLVADYTYEELLAYNFGYTFTDIYGKKPYVDKKVDIAKLEDLFITYPSISMIIEIKDEGDYGKASARQMKKLIEDYQMQDKVIIASFHHDVLQYFLEITDKKIPISTSQKDATKFVLSSKTWTGFLYFPEAVALQLPLKEAGLNLGTKRVINSAHHHNMAIHYWTINEKEEMRDLIEKGADGIITDRPDIMKELLIEMGF